MIKWSTPGRDGFYMPGEFEPHRGCIVIWPQRPGSWPYGAKAARRTFARMIEEISKSEKVYVFAGRSGIESAKEKLAHIENAMLIQAETDDAWARDIAPTFLVKGEEIRGINWEFNAWGGTYNGLYSSWQQDNEFAGFVGRQLGYELYDASPFVLEGGSIHCDGQGTVLTTESCLLSPGRNPNHSKEQIEEKLCEYLGAQKVIWLPCGIYQDETDEHVDNVCAFIRPGEVVLAWTDNENDPQYPMSKACLEALEGQTDAKGRTIKVHKLPIPDFPVCITKEDVKGYVFEEGEEERAEGERLAASYVNFYFSNEAVILPAFGGENEESDKRAVRIMQELCPDREVISVQARDILVGGGNIHCVTQQIPL